ncbi:MAG: hypothetical protein RH860_15605 [Cytophagales bacterium]
MKLINLFTAILFCLSTIIGCSEKDDADSPSNNPYQNRDDLVSKVIQTSTLVNDNGDTLSSGISESYFSYAFDPFGRLSTITLNGENKVFFEYDYFDRFEKIYKGDRFSKKLIWEFIYEDNIVNIYLHQYDNPQLLYRLEFDENGKPVLFTWVNSNVPDSTMNMIWESGNFIRREDLSNSNYSYLYYYEYSDIKTNVLLKYSPTINYNLFSSFSSPDFEFYFFKSKNISNRHLSLYFKDGDTIIDSESTWNIIPNENNYPKTITFTKRFYNLFINGEIVKDSATSTSIQTFEYY